MNRTKKTENPITVVCNNKHIRVYCEYILNDFVIKANVTAFI